MRCRKVCIFLISAIILWSSSVAIGAEEKVLRERSCHVIGGSYGPGCVYAHDVEIKASDLTTMDKVHLEKHIIENAGIEVYRVPCTTGGERNPQTHLPSDDYPTLPMVSLKEGAYEKINGSAAEEGERGIPVNLEISGTLNGKLEIMIYVNNDLYENIPQPVSPQEPTRPAPVQSPKVTEPPQLAGGIPTWDPQIEERIFPENVPGAPMETMDRKKEPVPAEPPQGADDSIHPLAEKTWHTVPNHDGNLLAMGLVTLSGLVALILGGSIASDVRIIRWHNSKKHRR